MQGGDANGSGVDPPSLVGRVSEQDVVPNSGSECPLWVKVGRNKLRQEVCSSPRSGPMAAEQGLTTTRGSMFCASFRAQIRDERPKDRCLKLFWNFSSMHWSACQVGGLSADLGTPALKR